MTADPTGSVDDAERVVADGGASYLDRVIAGTAGATSLMQLGDRQAAVECFERAAAIARDAGDVVARELVSLVRSVALSEELDGEVSHLGSGWKVVAESLGALVVDASGEPV